MSGLLIVVCVRRILVPVLIGPKHKQTRNNTAVATISLGMLVVCAGGVRSQHGPMVCAGGLCSQHGPMVCAGGFRSQHGPTETETVVERWAVLAASAVNTDHPHKL